MPEPAVERRRTPRVAVSGRRMAVPGNVRVRIVDISLGGVLMACSSPAPLEGSEGTLFLGLGGEPFIAELRLRPGPAQGARNSQRLLGAAFVKLNAASSQTLEAFLKKAKD